MFLKFALAKALGFKNAHEAPAPEPNETEPPAKKIKKDPKGKEPCETPNLDNTKPENPDMFKTYDMKALQIPMEARPQKDRIHGGSHGYTLKATNGAVSHSIFEFLQFSFL